MSQYSDTSTINVVKWLLYFKVPYVRIDQDDFYSIDTFEIKSNGDILYKIYDIKNNNIIDLSQVTAFWYRRGQITFKPPVLDAFTDNELKLSLRKFLTKELLKMEEIAYILLSNKPHINTFENRDLNKLNVLSLAAKCGLKIPHTRIITNTDKIPSGTFITKAISDTFHHYRGNVRFVSYTEKAIFDKWPSKLFPTQIQTELQKEADIRIFYLQGEFYSMAIMSQSNSQTMTDFRKYPSDKRNRSLSFKLPNVIEESLNQLMQMLELDSGSIDMILTPKGEFYFLEINPVGQYDMTSVPCNYYLDRLISLKLIQLSA